MVISTPLETNYFPFHVLWVYSLKRRNEKTLVFFKNVAWCPFFIWRHYSPGICFGACDKHLPLSRRSYIHFCLLNWTWVEPKKHRLDRGHPIGQADTKHFYTLWYQSLIFRFPSSKLIRAYPDSDCVLMHVKAHLWIFHSVLLFWSSMTLSKYTIMVSFNV